MDHLVAPTPVTIDLKLDPSGLAGPDLAYLVRGLWRGRGLELQAWAGATLPSGRPVTAKTLQTFGRLLRQAGLVRQKPVRGAPLELLASHREALARLAGVL